MKIKTRGSGDKAMSSEREVGGIDLKADKFNLDVHSDGQPMQFDFDPAKFKNLQFDGLIPNIITITPVADIALFFSEDKSKKVI